MAKTAHTFDEENIKYLRDLFGEKDINIFLSINEGPDRGTLEEIQIYKKVKKCLEQMEQFDDNRWWISEDKRVLGYYQLMNPLLLVPFDKFHEALEALLGRPVWTHEIGLNHEVLKEEAEKAFKKAFK